MEAILNAANYAIALPGGRHGDELQLDCGTMARVYRGGGHRKGYSGSLARRMRSSDVAAAPSEELGRQVNPGFEAFYGERSASVSGTSMNGR